MFITHSWNKANNLQQDTYIRRMCNNFYLNHNIGRHFDALCLRCLFIVNICRNKYFFDLERNVISFKTYFVYIVVHNSDTKHISCQINSVDCFCMKVLKIFFNFLLDLRDCYVGYVLTIIVFFICVNDY